MNKKNKKCPTKRLLLGVIIGGIMIKGIAIQTKTEKELTQMWCDKNNGQTEVRYYYSLPTGEKKHIIADCVTDSHIYEAGLDKRSSLDSIQQALFASLLSGKKPAVLIFSVEPGEGAIEYRIRHASVAANIRYDWVVQW